MLFFFMVVQSVKKMIIHKYFIKWTTDPEHRMGKHLGVTVDKEIIEKLFLL